MHETFPIHSPYSLLFSFARELRALIPVRRGLFNLSTANLRPQNAQGHMVNRIEVYHLFHSDASSDAKTGTVQAKPGCMVDLVRVARDTVFLLPRKSAHRIYPIAGPGHNTGTTRKRMTGWCCCAGL